MLKTIALLSMLGCSPMVWAQTPPATAGHPTAPVPADGPRSVEEKANSLSDLEIAQVLMTLDSGEITIAKQAEHQAQRKDVKEFAKHMQAQHQEHKEETKKLVGKTSLDATDSETNKSVQDSGIKAYDDLKKTNKKLFDKSYIDQQVSMHEKALEILNIDLMPSAHGAELRALLEKTRQAVTSHLEEARAIQSKLQ